MAHGNVQYGYAIQDKQDRVIGIDALTRESSSTHKYYCPHCRSEMYPTFGPKQEHHFRHNGTQCQHDNYLHSLAEKMFYEEYLKCLKNNEPFTLELHSLVACDRNCTEKKNRICTCCHNASCIDLTKIYNKVKLETSVKLEDGRYRRPDILLLSDNDEQLWIEIWVKHETQEEKRNDGRIIELKISTEKDLEQIKNHKLTKTTDNEQAIRLFNVELGEDFIINSTIHDVQTCTSFHELIQSSKPYAKPSYYKKHSSKPIGIDQSDGDFNPDSIEWTDLGLPSGALWAKEDHGASLPFNVARNKYSQNLPLKEHAQELKSCCERSWDSITNRIQFTGPNGNSICFQCKEKNISYWLRDYEDRRREFGQCFHLGQDKSFYINDKDVKSFALVRLIKTCVNETSSTSEPTLFQVL